MATQDEYIKTALRLPRSLHADIQASAKGLGRSMNAEIIARLQASFEQEERERWESTPQYADELVRAAMEVPPEGPARSLNKHFAEKRAEEEANLVAEKVVSKLISTEEFIEKLQRVLRQEGEGTQKK